MSDEASSPARCARCGRVLGATGATGMVWIEHMPGELCSRCLTGDKTWFALPSPEPWSLPIWKTMLILGLALLMPTVGFGWLVWTATGDIAIWPIMAAANVVCVAAFVWRSRQGRRLATQSKRGSA